jgi:hypothetical protein
VRTNTGDLDELIDELWDIDLAERDTEPRTATSDLAQADTDVHVPRASSSSRMVTARGTIPPPQRDAAIYPVVDLDDLELD